MARSQMARRGLGPCGSGQNSLVRTHFRRAACISRRVSNESEAKNFYLVVDVRGPVWWLSIPNYLKFRVFSIDGRGGSSPLLAPTFPKPLKTLGNRPPDGLLSVVAAGNCYGCPSAQALRLRSTPKRYFLHLNFQAMSLLKQRIATLLDLSVVDEISRP